MTTPSIPLEHVTKVTDALAELIKAAAAVPSAQEIEQKNPDAQPHEAYLGEFNISKKRLEKAHEAALDIRKFEIELYWKRSGYFWALVAATIAAYGLLLSSSMKDGRTLDFTTQIFLLGLSALGCIFSRAWLFASIGSKFWQANWETQVEMLEDEVTGPLYKSVFADHRNDVSKLTETAKNITPREGILISLFHRCRRSRSGLNQQKTDYLEKNEAFAVIYSPTKINDLMANLFFCLFLFLGVVSTALLIKDISVTAGFPEWWNNLPIGINNLRSIAKGTLLFIVVGGGCIGCYRLSKTCRTTTPMEHQINVTQRHVSITQNVTNDLKDYEYWKANHSANSNRENPKPKT